MRNYFRSTNKCKHVHKVVRSQNEKGQLKKAARKDLILCMIACYHANTSALIIAIAM